jgi:hypothetical protein
MAQQNVAGIEVRETKRESGGPHAQLGGLTDAPPVLKSDPRAIFTAASKAQQAAGKQC